MQAACVSRASPHHRRRAWPHTCPSVTYYPAWLSHSTRRASGSWQSLFSLHSKERHKNTQCMRRKARQAAPDGSSAPPSSWLSPSLAPCLPWLLCFQPHRADHEYPLDQDLPVRRVKTFLVRELSNAISVHGSAPQCPSQTWCFLVSNSVRQCALRMCPLTLSFAALHPLSGPNPAGGGCTWCQQGRQRAQWEHSTVGSAFPALVLHGHCVAGQ